MARRRWLVELFLTITAVIALISPADLGTTQAKTPTAPAERMSAAWEQLGLGGGGRFQSIDFSPRPNAQGSYAVYLGGDTCGLYKSEDDGASWAPINTGLYDFRTSKIVVSPDDPSTIYAATSGGLFKSVDGASSWSPINFGREFSTNQRNNALSSLALGPSDPKFVYVGTGNLSSEMPLHDGATEIHLSLDGGATWERVYRSSGYLVYGIAANPRRPESVYAALDRPGRGGLLLHSSNYGKAGTWEVVDADHGYYQLGFDDRNQLYATGKAPVRRRGPRSIRPDWGNAGPYVVRIPDKKNAVTKSDIVEITPSRVWGKPRATHGLAVTPQGDVYVGDPESANPAVWRYRQGVWSAMLPYDRHQPGWADFNWIRRPRATATCLGVAPDGTPWHGGSMQLYRWGAGRWEQKYTQRTSTSGYRTRGNSNTVIFSRDMIFLDRDEYYWGPADIYVEGTRNGGKDCVRVRFPDPSGRMNDVRVLTADSQNPHIWYVVTHLQDQKTDHAKLLRKDDDGTWHTVLTSCRTGSACPFRSPTIPNGGGILDVAAGGPVIIVSTYADGVYRSDDRGASWSKVRSLDKALISKFSRSGLEPRLLMAAASGRGEGVWLSDDDGATWNRIRSALAPHYAVAWAGSTTWFVSEEDRILRTRDNGRTWETVYTWPERPDIFDNRSPDSNDICVGLVDPYDPDKNPVAAAFTIMGYFDHSSMGGVACSLDGGLPGTWKRLDMNGVTYHGWGVEFNPFDPSELFYLTYGSGIYRTKLAGPALLRAPASSIHDNRSSSSGTRAGARIPTRHRRAATGDSNDRCF